MVPHRSLHGPGARLPSMGEATFTFRLVDDLKARFSEAAKAHDRTATRLLCDFMRNFVRRAEQERDHGAWFREQVCVALRSANSGRLVPEAEVEAEFRSRRAKTLRTSDNSGS